MKALVFQKSQPFIIGGNTFIDVPVIIQYENTPMIEIVKRVGAGYTTKIPIYHNDGTYLAKAVGSRLFSTEAGKKAGLKLRYELGKTVCEMGGKFVFEIQHAEAAAFKTLAELYTRDGAFVQCTDATMLGYVIGPSKDQLAIQGNILKGNTWTSLRIGIWVRSDGSVQIAVT